MAAADWIKPVARSMADLAGRLGDFDQGESGEGDPHDYYRAYMDEAAILLRESGLWAFLEKEKDTPPKTQKAPPDGAEGAGGAASK